MKKAELKKLGRAELLQLKADVEVVLAENEAEEKARVKDEARKLIEAAGFNIEDILGGKAAPQKRTPPPPKYRSKEDPSLTWSGRGRRPPFIKEHIEAGGSIEDLKI